jgi:hypothetical protein
MDMRGWGSLIFFIISGTPNIQGKKRVVKFCFFIFWESLLYRQVCGWRSPKRLMGIHTREPVCRHRIQGDALHFAEGLEIFDADFREHGVTPVCCYLFKLMAGSVPAVGIQYMYIILLTKLR